MGTSGGPPDTVPRQWVTAGFFDALGVTPVAGRTFLASDDTQRTSVVVISEGLWRTRFNADPGVVGREIRLDGDPWTIVGVAPNEAQVLPTSIWALLPVTGAPPRARGQYPFQAIGRMKPGITIEAAAADLGAVAAGLAREFPQTNAGRGVALQPMRDFVIGGDLRRSSALFLVGVVRQVKERPDETEAMLQIYVPLAQDTPGDVFMLVRSSSGSADGLASPVRAALARVDKEQLVSVRDIMTLDEVAADATARHRFRAVLVIAFAALALVLAMVGLFGILAHAVQQRVREFGVRRALGATTGDVFRIVAVSAARVIGAGAIVGVALSILLGRLLTTMLFGVEPSDPLTFALVGAVLAITAAVSIAAPAWRATRIDPAVALRTE